MEESRNNKKKPIKIVILSSSEDSDSTQIDSSSSEDSDNDEKEVKTYKTCKGLTKKGTKCTKRCGDNSYCHLHDPQLSKKKDPKCSKKKEIRGKCSFYNESLSVGCNDYALKGEIYCTFHYTLNIQIENSRKYREMLESLSKLNMLYEKDKFINPILNAKFKFLPDKDKDVVRSAIIYFKLDRNNLTIESVNKQYKVYSLKHHPDKGGSVEEFKKMLNYKTKLVSFLS